MDEDRARGFVDATAPVPFPGVRVAPRAPTALDRIAAAGRGALTWASFGAGVGTWAVLAALLASGSGCVVGSGTSASSWCTDSVQMLGTPGLGHESAVCDPGAHATFYPKQNAVVCRCAPALAPLPTDVSDATDAADVGAP